MNLSTAFPSRFLKAADLSEEGSQVVTIEKISLEEIGRDRETKPVLYFQELQQGLVLNKTNARIISRSLGSEEFDDWLNKRIALYRADVEFQGEMVESIRVKSAKQPERKPATPGMVKPKPATVPSDEVDEDGIPF